MDNYNQPIPSASVSGSVVQPAAQPAPAQSATEPKDHSGLIKTIVIIILSLVAATFIGLFVWMFLQYNAARSDVYGQINVAVAKAVDAKAEELENEFAEREKDPYKSFSGPEDYGQLSFKYPKTWSVYIAADATKGGDYNAYFNPGEVNPVSDSTVNALRVTIRNKSYDDVVAEYQRIMNQKDAGLTVSAITINGAPANRYAGKIPKTDLNGYIVIFKIRDKTAVVQTDSTLFENDFNTLLDTITFNS